MRRTREIRRVNLLPRLPGGRAALAALLLFASAGFCGCARTRPSPFAPYDNLLAIAADYQIARATDIYHFDFPRDLTGQNVARATLVRLANYESLNPGRFAPEIEFLKGQAYADLGDYESARAGFEQCAGFDSPLRPRAAEAAGVCAEMQALLRPSPESTDPEAFLADLERRAAELRALAERHRATRWETLARIETESLEVARAEFLDACQAFLPEGESRALRAFEALAADHAGSRRALSHALRLARFHLDRARRLERLADPERATFDRAAWMTRLEEALEILHRVSQADGRPEKIEARHLLDAALAYADRVRERAR